MNEFNHIDDNLTPPELNNGSEFNALSDNPQGLEFSEAQENGAQKPKRKKIGKKNAGVISAFVASVAAVAVIGVSVGVPAVGTKAEIAEMWATDTSIVYEVIVPEESERLKIVAYNDFTHREVELTAGENSGEFSDLQPDMQYTVAIQGNFGFGAQTLLERTIRTDTLRPPLVTQWRGITHECTCNIDGYFRFIMDYIDENGRWTDFEATLTDEYGNTAVCEFSSDPHGEQKIDVIGNKIIGNTATFIVGCTANGEKTELYRAQVKI